MVVEKKRKEIKPITNDEVYKHSYSYVQMFVS